MAGSFFSFSAAAFAVVYPPLLFLSFFCFTQLTQTLVYFECSSFIHTSSSLPPSPPTPSLLLPPSPPPPSPRPNVEEKIVNDLLLLLLLQRKKIN